MSKTILIRVLGATIFAAALLACEVSAQTAVAPATTAQAAAAQPAPSARKQIRRIPSLPARVTVIPSQSKVAPQVVTIVHRLSGVKILRLLLRQAGESGVVETIDPETLTNDAHASIIAGWAMDDGKTITARLPQAAAEIEVTESERRRPEQKARAATTEPFSLMRPRVEPDLTVITGDGRKFHARLIGLDAETGLSVLQVVGLPPLTAPRLPAPKLTQGQAVEIFAPEPATPEGEATTRITYVKVGKTDATVANVMTAGSASFEKLIVRGVKLSPDVIGGIACDQSGSTVGIIESIDGDSARIVGADTVREAARRVLDRQASVPRPLLGVRGEPVEFAARAAFLANGWRDDQLGDLMRGQVGILLTSVTPKTPAALAKLQPGDVILRVNQNEVKNAEEFSKLLGDAGSGEQVEFTIRRPDATTPLSIPVTLGGSFAPMFEWRLEMPAMPAPFFGLQGLGIQTMALTPRAAAQMGAQNGFIVVFVQPKSAAARGGIREGDVIESIDGRMLGRGVWTLNPQFMSQKKHTFSIVRAREKKQIVLELVE
jgi:S1-C subfamily serine protease